MKYEPNKILKGQEFICFYPSLDGVNVKDPRTAYYIAGTADAYKALVPFFENQIELCEQFESATKAIVCRKPVDLSNPLEVAEMALEFAAEIKIKIRSHPGESSMILHRKELTIETSIEDLKRALEVCQKRQTLKNMQPLEFLGFTEARLISLPLGQWKPSLEES